MRNVFDMQLQDEPFEKIRRGEKTVEIRLNDEKRKEIKVGDQIVFHRVTDESDVIISGVTALYPFPTFRDLFASALFHRTGLGDLTVDAAAEYMYGFYSKEQEKRYGVLAIGIIIA